MVSASTRVFKNQFVDYLEKKQAFHEPIERANALDRLSLTVRDGETLSILGPSGCGKSTLLKIIAGLLKPDEGDVLYDGASIDDTLMSDRGIGMVFQSYALYPHMRARENIGFYDTLRRQPEKIPERIHHIAEVLGVEIKHLLSRKPPTLSGGEQQRVAVARCLARDPKIFLFDEPLSNLDAKLRVDTRVQIKRLLQHYRITSVYVTHDQYEAIALGDRIAIMRAGKIEQVGTYHNLYDTPLNAFVAQFFGTPPMNLFAGHAWDDTWEGRGFTVRPIRPGLRKGQAVWLGIRPEHIELVEDGIPAHVDRIEPMFPQQRQVLYLDLNRQECLVSAGLDTHIEPNTTVHVRFPAAHLYLFDKDTGARIG
ncbi:MAG: ABC transporter ATP-binding protein [Anaerolineae bacterium]|nr:ABC transporter ATP-binding protein [Anaerolineae bacterium]